jgi:UPF0755 protein
MQPQKFLDTGKKLGKDLGSRMSDVEGKGILKNLLHPKSYILHPSLSMLKSSFMKNWLKIIIGIFLLVFVGVSYYLFSLLQPVDKNSQEKITFIVPKGQAVSIIGDRLAEKNIIKNSLVFNLVARKEHLVEKIQAGTFELSPSMGVWEIAFTMTQGTNDLWVTFPEGWRREEIADYLEKQELSVFNKDDFLMLTEELEGYLFPDTFLVPKEVATQTIVELLTNTFEKKILLGLEEEIDDFDYKFSEVLVMASLIEREAYGYEQMQIVSGILWNRIEIGMPLQVDATLQHIKGFSISEQTWWSTPYSQDKKIKSKSNTYLNKGLPPAPICNPGLSAVKAALNPIETNDLYYLHGDDKQIHTAKTLSEHNQNINKYLQD